MKNSQEYARKIQKLYRSLKQSYVKAKSVTYERIIDVLVYGCLSEYLSESAAKAALKKLEEHFVDINEIRVSRPTEIAELLETDKATAKKVSLRLINTLMGVFNKYNTLSLETLQKLGKKPARQVLVQIVGEDGFVVDYCMMTAMGGHSIPLSESMVEYLKEYKMVHPETGREDIQSFLVRQIPAKNGYEFYCFLKQESETKRKKVSVGKTQAGAKTEKKKVKKTS